MPKRTVARHERAIRQIRLRIKARGCTASGRTASYFYIISTWRSRYYVPGLSPVPLHRPPHLCSLFFFSPAKPAVFLETAVTPPPTSPPRCISCFLEASHAIRTSRSVASPLSLSLSHPRFVKAHCVAVYTRSKRFLS